MRSTRGAATKNWRIYDQTAVEVRDPRRDHREAMPQLWGADLLHPAAQGSREEASGKPGRPEPFRYLSGGIPIQEAEKMRAKNPKVWTTLEDLKRQNGAVQGAEQPEK
jgi:hypothetical protein